MDMPTDRLVSSIAVLPGSREYDHGSVPAWRTKEGATAHTDGFYSLWRELARKEDGKEHNVQPVTVTVGEEEVVFDPFYRSSSNGVVGDLYSPETPGDRLAVHLLIDDEGGLSFELIEAGRVA